ncbi:MAG TPA: oligosaccharide flippase family protein, partial [Bacteroidota bacterium]
MNRDIAISVARNTTVMMTSQVVTWISSFILMLFLPRYLGSAEYGRLYVAISVTMMFQMVIEFGGQYFVAKEVSRSQENIQGLVVNSAVMRGMLWVVSL